MKKKKKNNDTKKILITIVIIILILLIAAGSTFSYWSWEINTVQQTKINVITTGGKLTINGDNVENIANETTKGMHPTIYCSGDAALFGEAEIIAENKTERMMRVTPRLDIKITPASGRTLSDDAKSHLHWAVVETTTTTSKTCSNPDYTGTFDKIAKITVAKKDTVNNLDVSSPTIQAVPANSTTTINITNINTSNIITSTLTFEAAPLATTTKKYKVYVWLDSTYTHTNVGDAITDPMQELGITVKWSANSTMIQE